jgi:hypothetical protein
MMSEQILLQRFTRDLFDILDETFGQHHGIYLDRNTSLFQTLDTISAEEASKPVSERCATIAAQVEHITFYLEVLERGLRGEEIGRVDWGEIWRTVAAVTAEEWDASKQRLKARYGNILELMQTSTWEGEDDIGEALAILVHTAYHLGEIRQALCVVKRG